MRCVVDVSLPAPTYSTHLADAAADDDESLEAACFVTTGDCLYYYSMVLFFSFRANFYKMVSDPSLSQGKAVLLPVLQISTSHCIYHIVSETLVD